MSAHTYPKNWQPKGVKGKLAPFIGSGKSLREVAKEIGCSHVAVWSALKKTGQKL